MKRKIIRDWKAVSQEELFLYELQNRLLHFYRVDKKDIIEFCKFCIDNNLLEFVEQEEYGGCPAKFRVLKDFNIQLWNPSLNNAPIYTMEYGDKLNVTEFIEIPTRKRGFMNLYDVWSIDIPTGDTRLKFYEWVKEVLCGK